jgi:hypothetical protein
VAPDPGDQLLPQRAQRPLRHLTGQRETAQEVRQAIGERQQLKARYQNKRRTSAAGYRVWEIPGHISHKLTAQAATGLLLRTNT